MMNRVSASIFLCYNADRGENKMDEYVSKLKQLLRYEAGRPGRMCGVYDTLKRNLHFVLYVELVGVYQRQM